MPKDPITKDQAVNSLDLLRIVVAETVELNEEDYACCPFHNEATTSFNIFKAKSGRARYHCFGCGVDGDIFNYLQQTKQLNFRSAIDFISKLIDREVVASPSEQSERLPSHNSGLLDMKDKSCEADCPKYAALREDYNAILEQSYTDAGVDINPDLQTVPALVNEITWLKNRVKELEAQLKRSRKSSVRLDGFGTA